MLLASGKEYVLNELIISVVEFIPIRKEFFLETGNNLGELKV